MLYHVITFDEKGQNLSALVIFYKVIRGSKPFLTRCYENLDLKKNTKKIKLAATFFFLLGI